MNNASSNIIQALPHLCPEAAKLHEALEKHTREIEEKAERIRAPIQKSSPKGRKPTQISNPLYGAQILREYPRWADDILQGVARLDWYRTTGRSIPLSVRKLIKLLIHLPVLSTQCISSLSKAERIRTPIQKSSPKGRKPTQISNPLYGAQVLREYPLWADDILQGVARLDWYRTTGRSIPLSVRKLIKLLIHLPVLSTQCISSLLLLEERQARRYLEALKLALPFLLKSMPENLERIDEITDDKEWIEHAWVDPYA
ncbi:hypothetical protein [Pseudomonas duriflava]|nr:hypothetical protein [Pseudomonas duriflava]